MKTKQLTDMNNVLKAVTLMSIMIVFNFIGCSQSHSQTPEEFIKVFLTKYIPFLDTSIAELYVKDEQSRMRDLILQNIQKKQKGGTYNSLKNATYDLTDIRVTVLDIKGMYINDEPKTLVEVVAKGFYTVKTVDQKDTYLEDEIFILQEIGNEWKIS